MEYLVSDYEFKFKKQPSEKEMVGVDFSRRVTKDRTITSMSASAMVLWKHNMDCYQGANDIVVDTVVQYGSFTVLAMISGGQDTFDYKLTFKIELDNGELKEDDVLIQIKEK